MPTLKCWDNSGWIVYLLGKQCYNSNRNLRQKVSPNLDDMEHIKLPLPN